MLFLKKSTPAPTCLKTEKEKNNGDYKCGTVLERLAKDFKNKCYICGTKSLSSGINIEHFRPHKDKDNELKFSWDNLFLACAHCNQIKSDDFENLLDCTDKGTNIESRIKFILNSFPKNTPIITPLTNDLATVETVELLNLVYKGTTVQKKLQSSFLRNSILEEMNSFKEILEEYFDPEYPLKHRDKCLKKIKEHLNSDSAYTAFKRWYIRENDHLKDELEKYFK